MSSDEPKLRSLGFRNGVEWLELSFDLETPGVPDDLTFKRLAVENGFTLLRWGFDRSGFCWLQGTRLEPPKDAA